MECIKRARPDIAKDNTKRREMKQRSTISSARPFDRIKWRGAHILRRRYALALFIRLLRQLLSLRLFEEEQNNQAEQEDQAHPLAGLSECLKLLFRCGGALGQ